MYEGKANPQVTFDMLIDKLGHVDLQDLKGVLRKVQRGDDSELFLVPANGAIAILLRKGYLDSELDFNEIKTTISMWYKQKENEVEKRK